MTESNPRIEALCKPGTLDSTSPQTPQIRSLVKRVVQEEGPTWTQRKL